MSAFLFRILSMKKIPVYLFILIFLAGCKDTTKTKSGTPVDNWNLVWGDEFDKEGLPDSTKWSYNTGGHGWGNQELQFYTENRRENARIENGNGTGNPPTTSQCDNVSKTWSNDVSPLISSFCNQ